MDKVLPLRFTWEPATSGLFLRTKLVYAFEQYKNDPVRRCYNHAASTSDNQTMTPDKLKHVVHCINYPNSVYMDDNNHLSV